jgi:hypothetical protein
MKIFQPIESYKDYQASILKKNSAKNDKFIFTQFQDEFGDRLIDSITSDEILSLKSFSKRPIHAIVSCSN